MTDNTATQQVELPPAFIQARGEIAAARKKLLKDQIFNESKQLRQFIAQYVLPLMDGMTTLFGSAFVDTYNLGVMNHETVTRLKENLREGDMGSSLPRVDIDDLNDLQKAFYTLGSVIESKADPDTQAAFDVCSRALSEFVGRVMDDARDDEDDRDEDHDDDDSDDRDDDHVDDTTEEST